MQVRTNKVASWLKEDEEEEQDVEEEVPELIDDNQEVDNEWPAEMNKEWLVDQYMEGQSTPDRTIKKKRSATFNRP